MEPRRWYFEVWNHIMKDILSTIINFRGTESKNDDDAENNTEDYMAKSIGAFGMWQTAVCTATSLTRFTAMWNMTSIFFLTPDTKFRCVEFKDNTTTDVLNSTCYDDCLKYDFQHQGLNSTIVSDFELICDRAWLASFAQSILMFGLLLGTSLFGWISDRFGRRICLLTSVLFNTVFMLITPLAPNYWTFSFFRFLTGVTSGGTLIIGVVYVMEVVGKRHREAASCCVTQPDGLAQASLVLFAYLSSTWKYYILGYSLASVFILIGILFVPESPRWLVSNGKGDKAIAILTYAARCNNLSTTNIRENVNKSIEELKINDKEAAKLTYLDLFRTKELTRNTVCVFVIWTVCGTCYFGVNQYLSFVGSNLYLSILILGLIQAPVGCISLLINTYFGRKYTAMLPLITSAAVMIFLIFTSGLHWITPVLGIIGLAAINLTYIVIYIYVSELFPTQLRNMAYGFCSTGAKVGAMIAPFIANMRPQWIPSLVFACLLFIAACFSAPLPETKGQNLKDTVD